MIARCLQCGAWCVCDRLLIASTDIILRLHAFVPRVAQLLILLGYPDRGISIACVARVAAHQAVSVGGSEGYRTLHADRSVA